MLNFWCLIVTFCQVILYRSSTWKSQLVYHLLMSLFYSLNCWFPFEVLNIKLFKQKYFWMFKITYFYLQNTCNSSLSSKRFYYQLSSRCQKILKKDPVNPFFCIMSQERCGVFIFLSWQKSKFNRACFFGFFSSLVEVVSGLIDSFVVFGSKISFCFWISTNWIRKTFSVTCFHTVSTDRYLEILSGKRRF